jgi:hypothetical protein
VATKTKSANGKTSSKLSISRVCLAPGISLGRFLKTVMFALKGANSSISVSVMPPPPTIAAAVALPLTTVVVVVVVAVVCGRI